MGTEWKRDIRDVRAILFDGQAKPWVMDRTIPADRECEIGGRGVRVAISEVVTYLCDWVEFGRCKTMFLGKSKWILDFPE